MLSDHGGNNGNGSEASIFFWFWIPLFALGFARPWIDLRYSLMIYPLYLAIFAWTIFRMICFGCEKVGDTSLLEGLLSNGHRLILGTGLSIFLVLFPALNEHHGIQDALKVGRLTYGQPISPLFHGFPFHPDHQGAGRYVRANLDENDIVISMDIFEQYYYVGRIDYWLIKGSDALQFSYGSGRERYDIYTNTRVLGAKRDLEEILSQRIENRVWIITSAEFTGKHANFVPRGVNDFLSESKERLIYVGRDNRTNVYLF